MGVPILLLIAWLMFALVAALGVMLLYVGCSTCAAGYCGLAWIWRKISPGVAWNPGVFVGSPARWKGKWDWPPGLKGQMMANRGRRLYFADLYAELVVTGWVAAQMSTMCRKGVQGGHSMGRLHHGYFPPVFLSTDELRNALAASMDRVKSGAAAFTFRKEVTLPTANEHGLDGEGTAMVCEHRPGQPVPSERTPRGMQG